MEDGDESKSKQQVKESPKGKRRSSLDKKERGRGKEQKKKGKKDVVTSASVFSMGPADRPMPGRTGIINNQSRWLILAAYLGFSQTLKNMGRPGYVDTAARSVYHSTYIICSAISKIWLASLSV